jgi:hypothetical protein
MMCNDALHVPFISPFELIGPCFFSDIAKAVARRVFEADDLPIHSAYRATARAALLLYGNRKPYLADNTYRRVSRSPDSYF